MHAKVSSVMLYVSIRNINCYMLSQAGSYHSQHDRQTYIEWSAFFIFATSRVRTSAILLIPARRREDRYCQRGDIACQCFLVLATTSFLLVLCCCCRFRKRDFGQYTSVKCECGRVDGMEEVKKQRWPLSGKCFGQWCRLLRVNGYA